MPCSAPFGGFENSFLFLQPDLIFIKRKFAFVKTKFETNFGQNNRPNAIKNRDPLPLDSNKVLFNEIQLFS